MSTQGRVIVIGGSLIGLLAGNILHRAGWDVHIYERASDDLEGRGAGITILPGLIEAFRAAGAEVSEDSLGIALRSRAALDLSGAVIAQREFLQYMTSWGRLYEALKQIFPAGRYHGGMHLQHVEQDERSVQAVFANGQRAGADFLIGADGLRSTLRAQLLPQIKAHYAGYIAWRCLTDELDLPSATFAPLFERYTVGITPGEQCIGYPVPGPRHCITPGERQFNVVWYHPVGEADELPRLMTDDAGRYYPGGIPPALLSARVREQMIRTAQEQVPPQFALALKHGRWHFFQPIYDLEPPQLVFGRIALVGDAAFITRPHVAMGVPKGAGDVLDLVAALNAPGSLQQNLQTFEAKRLRVDRAIVARGRYLGAYMEAQLGSPEERAAAQAKRVPEQVMMDTAAPLDYEALAARSKDPPHGETA